MQIYHNPNSSYIDNNTGHLFIRNNVDNDDGGNIYIQAKSGEQGIIINDDGAVQIYHDNSQKLVTSSTGVTVTGTVVATSFTGDLTGDVTGSISGGTIAGSTGTFTGDVDIADKIVHTGDTDTAIRFPDADTITAETGGSERVRIASDGKVGIGQATPAGQLHISSGTSGDCELIIEADTDNNDENDNPRILFRQDGGYDESMVGMDDNHLVLANSVSVNGGIVFKTGTDSAGYTNATECMRIQPNGEIAMRSNGACSDALANLHVQNDSFRVSNDSDGADTTYIHLHAHTNATDGDRNIFKHVSDDVIMSQITRQGQIFSQNGIYVGRTRTDEDDTTNVYRNGTNGFYSYSGTTDDTTAYRNIAFIRAWDGGDTGDRNVIYYTDSGSDTDTSDYDQDQKFGVKANGMAQFGRHIYAGRVESDEGSPNSVYTGSNGNTIITYPGSASQSTRIDARTTDGSEAVYKADTGGGVTIKFEADGDGRFDGQADIGTASDYAEYFEWLDGNTSSADRRGMTVVMDGEKIRPATDSDDTSKIIGVVSAKPAVVGDSAWSEWQLAHLKDAYGSWVTEDKEYLVWNKFGTFTDTDGVKNQTYNQI